MKFTPVKFVSACSVCKHFNGCEKAKGRNFHGCAEWNTTTKEASK